MIKGIGIDVIETERIEKAMQNEAFLERILTERERESPLSAQSAAGKWAAKEAVAKAFGTHLKWHDIEILKDSDGRPRVVGEALGGNQVMISISHEKGIAAAVAIWEAE